MGCSLCPHALFSQARSHICVCIPTNYNTVHMHVFTFNRPEQYYAIAAAAVNNISSARPVFDSLDWSEENYRMLERIGQTSEQVNVCVSGKGKVSSFNLLGLAWVG